MIGRRPTRRPRAVRNARGTATAMQPTVRGCAGRLKQRRRNHVWRRTGLRDRGRGPARYCSELRPLRVDVDALMRDDAMRVDALRGGAMRVGALRDDAHALQDALRADAMRVGALPDDALQDALRVGAMLVDALQVDAMLVDALRVGAMLVGALRGGRAGAVEPN